MDPFPRVRADGARSSWRSHLAIVRRSHWLSRYVQSAQSACRDCITTGQWCPRNVHEPVAWPRYSTARIDTEIRERPAQVVRTVITRHHLEPILQPCNHEVASSILAPGSNKRPRHQVAETVPLVGEPFPAEKSERPPVGRALRRTATRPCGELMTLYTRQLAA